MFQKKAPAAAAPDSSSSLARSLPETRQAESDPVVAQSAVSQVEKPAFPLFSKKKDKQPKQDPAPVAENTGIKNCEIMC